MCKKLTEARDSGQRLNIILVAEGAVDREGKPITATQVSLISKKAVFLTSIVSNEFKDKLVQLKCKSVIFLFKDLFFAF
jgi:hypothetical protein